MRLEKFIKDMKRGMGNDRALKVAEMRMKASNPMNWKDLPAGYIFFPNDVKNKTGYREKHLKKLHNFWTNVYYIMRKQK